MLVQQVKATSDNVPGRAPVKSDLDKCAKCKLSYSLRSECRKEIMARATEHVAKL
jgi:hypothetical protein